MKKAGNISLNKKGGLLLKFFVVAIILLFFIFIINFFASGIKNTFYTFSSPVQKTFWTAGESCSGFFNSFISAGSLTKEKQNLQEENQKLLSEITSLRAITGGNKAQSDVSSACQNNEFKLIMAGVIGLDDQDMMSINKGSADGILENMPVINQQGAIFGKIYKVYKNFSKVMLISNKNSVISVRVQSQEAPLDASQTPKPEIDGVIKGTGKLGVYLDLVPIDVTINQGDILATSSLEATFPKDLLVGIITKVEKNDQNPHQQAAVQPFLEAAVDNLFVITNYKR